MATNTLQSNIRHEPKQQKLCTWLEAQNTPNSNYGCQLVSSNNKPPHFGQKDRNVSPPPEYTATPHGNVVASSSLGQKQAYNTTRQITSHGKTIRNTENGALRPVYSISKATRYDCIDDAQPVDYLEEQRLIEKARKNGIFVLRRPFHDPRTERSNEIDILLNDFSFMKKGWRRSLREWNDNDIAQWFAHHVMVLGYDPEVAKAEMEKRKKRIDSERERVLAKRAMKEERTAES